MSIVNDKTSDDWVDENHPDNGLFRVYWKKPILNPCEGGATLDPNEGEGLRYEWYYKDGKRVDGESKSWYPNGVLKHIWNWKNGIQNGLYTNWYDNGQKKEEGIYKNREKDGLWIVWWENGQKREEGTYKDGKPADGLITQWYENGHKKLEWNYKDGKKEGNWTLYYKDGKGKRTQRL